MNDFLKEYLQKIAGICFIGILIFYKMLQDESLACTWLLIVSIGSWIYSSRKLKQIRNAIGEDYENNESYINFNKIETYSKLAFLILWLLMEFVDSLGMRTSVHNLGGALFVTAIYTFVKSRFLKRRLGENYSESTNYKIYVNLAKIAFVASIALFNVGENIDENPAETAARIQHEEEMAEWHAREAERDREERKNKESKILRELSEYGSSPEEILRNVIDVHQKFDPNIKNKTFLLSYSQSEMEKDVKKTLRKALNDKVQDIDGFEDFDADDDVEIYFRTVGVNTNMQVKIHWNEDNNPLHKSGTIECTWEAYLNPDRTWRIWGPLQPVSVNIY